MADRSSPGSADIPFTPEAMNQATDGDFKLRHTRKPASAVGEGIDGSRYREVVEVFGAVDLLQKTGVGRMAGMGSCTT